MKLVSIVTACYNEELNVDLVYRRVRDVMAGLPQYRYEHLFIDNASHDSTVSILRRLAAEDSNVRIIVNARNVGAIRSSTHALFQATGDAVISIVADLQDPPDMIPTLVAGWEEGFDAVIGVKRSSEESGAMFWIRRQYYRLAERLSSIETIENFTGFGLYSRRFMDVARSFRDPYPFFRGLIPEIGLPYKKIPYDQPRRRFGISSYNWYSLYDIGMLGIINHSRVPLRLAVLAGFAGAAGSFVVGCIYLLYKLFFWYSFEVGLAPMLIGIFFVASLQLVFLGVLGEYVGAIYTQVQQRPYTVELERINLPTAPDAPPTQARPQP